MPRDGQRLAALVLIFVAVMAVTVPAVSAAGTHPEVEVSFDWLYYAETEEGMTGGAEWGTVGLSANSTGRLRVAFFEELPGGAGLSNRAAGWIAAIVASTVLGVDLFDYTLSFEAPGLSDGPSAGGIMTAGVMAAMLGHSILPHVSMTGTINPDGTIGPVGGIPQKVEGAAAAGKTLVLVPVGGHLEPDPDGGEPVDVLEYGKKLGVTVQEVADIYEAYRLLTGHELRENPRMPSEEELVLSPQAVDALRRGFERWQKRLMHLDERLKAHDMSLAQEVMALAGEARKAMDAGDGALAWGLMLDATMLADRQRAGLEVLALLGEAQKAFEQQVEEWGKARERLEAFREALNAFEPGSMGAAIGLMQAYGMVVRAEELFDLADLYVSEAREDFPTKEYLSQLDDPSPILEGESGPWTEAIYHLLRAALSYHRVDVLREMGEDLLAVALADDVAPVELPAPERVERLGLLYRAGSLAGVEYLDWVVINDLAKEMDVHPGHVYSVLLMDDPDFGVALSAAFELASSTGPNPYALLGVAGTIFNDISLLIASYYSLDAEKDDGEVVAVEREDMFLEQLRRAEREAAIAIAAAHDAGMRPTISQVLFQVARHHRHQSLHQQVEALRQYWQAGFLARTAVWLSKEPVRLGPAAAAYAR